ncbi:transposase domain-containing protein [Nocardiopsis synnemataformans]|uniref:transposase domain-containing protein n=1 Tax=Nocardiopsis synnemataformans TaxID=61305 RepID=UPI003EBE2276
MSTKTSHSNPGAPLSDQCAVTREITVAKGLFAPGHLGEPTRIVPFDMVDEALAGTGATQRRSRKLPERGRDGSGQRRLARGERDRRAEGEQ